MVLMYVIRGTGSFPSLPPGGKDVQKWSKVCLRCVLESKSGSLSKDQTDEEFLLFHRCNYGC